MKFNQVTWYSKIAALILFVALPFIGFYVGMWYQKNISSPENEVASNGSGNATSSASQNSWKTIVSSEEISVKTKYENGKLKYSGTVQVPTACYKLTDKTTVLGSDPEQVQIRISSGQTKSNAPDAIGVCAQVITDLEFAGEVEVSSQAVVSVYLNGEKVE